MNVTSPEWQTSDHEIFWGEIAPAEHVVQIYENDVVFLNLLEGFVHSGITAGECVILIATSAHLKALTNRLIQRGHAIEALMADDQLILLDAKETLAKFMVNGWPESKLFHQTVSGIIQRGKVKNRIIRAFGEMVAVLWAERQVAATVHLEILWNKFCETEKFCLLCAYPRAGFTQDINSSAHAICCAHAKMISGEHKSKTHVFYKTVLGPTG